MTSPQALVRLVRRMAPSQPRMGFVTAVDLAAQTVTVAFEDGSTTTSLSWASSSYTSPAAGDRVLVIPTTTGWVVSSKITPRPVLVPSTQVSVPTVHNWLKAKPLNYAPVGVWGYQYDYTTSSAIAQGPVPVQSGGTGATPTNQDVWATVMHHGSLAAAVPSGATIQNVTLTIARDAPYKGNPPLAAPTLFGHTYTAASPPNPAAAPVWAPGFGPLRTAPIAPGDVSIISIPPAWVTAWLAGTITGIGLYTEAADDGMTAWSGAVPDSGHLTITYTGGTS